MAPRRPRISVPNLTVMAEGGSQTDVVGRSSAPKRGRSAASDQEIDDQKRQRLESEKGKEVEEAQRSKEPEFWCPALTYRKRTVRTTDRICQLSNVAYATSQALLLPRDFAEMKSSIEVALLKGIIQDSVAVS